MIYVIYMMVYDYMICVIVSTKPIKAQIPDFLGDKHKKSLVAKKKSGISISALSPQSLYNIHQKKQPAAIGEHQKHLIRQITYTQK
jgi:hypothetical protein